MCRAVGSRYDRRYCTVDTRAPRRAASGARRSTRRRAGRRGGRGRARSMRLCVVALLFGALLAAPLADGARRKSKGAKSNGKASVTVVASVFEGPRSCSVYTATSLLTECCWNGVMLGLAARLTTCWRSASLRERKRSGSGGTKREILCGQSSAEAPETEQR